MAAAVEKDSNGGLDAGSKLVRLGSETPTFGERGGGDPIGVRRTVELWFAP